MGEGAIVSVSLLHVTALPRSSDWSNCADLLPVAAIIAKPGESFSLPAALNPVNGEMPAFLNDATIFSGANAICQASLISAGTSERVMIWQALIVLSVSLFLEFQSN